MAKEIIINAEKEHTRIAIVEDGELVELYIENPENERTLGNVFLARVRKVMPSIRAAFVDIGQKQDAFLHFSDLSDNLPELLEFLEDDKPAVGKVVHEADAQKAKGKRRRPQGRRRGGSKGGGTSEDTSDEEKKDRKKADARTRGQRRQAQHRRSKEGSSEGTASSKQPGGEKKQRSEERNAALSSYLKRDARILVKITKEPISNKGSRVSTDISLAGRFLVLVPLANYVAVSKKIVSYKERRRLRTLAKSLVPEGFGVIVRTVASGKNAKALDTDLRLLVEKWRKIEEKLQGSPKPPVLAHEDVNMASSVIRDLFSDDYDRILIDDQRVYRKTKGYVQAVAPHMAPAVKLHQSKEPIFEVTRIKDDVMEAFESRVDLPSGGYLFIERTEAMHVVDVNSGRSGRGMKQEDSSLKVNLEAARVIARQVRLRDLGGIIVVDFIDLRDEKNKRKVYDELKKEFRRDRAVTKLLPMSDFGLIQITRQRLRPSITTYANPDGRSNTNGTPGEEESRSSQRRGRTSDKESRPTKESRSTKESRPAKESQTPDKENQTPEKESRASDKESRTSSKGGRTSDKESRSSSNAPRTSQGKSERSGKPSAQNQRAADESAENGKEGRSNQRSRGRGSRGGRSKGGAAPPSDVSPEDLVKQMEGWVTQYKADGNRGAVTLKVHPFTAAFLNRRVPNHPTRWFMKHLVRVRVETDETLDPLVYRFFDARSGEDVTEAKPQDG
ncbi:MAG: Rne/Rng family ribonuclease [Rhodothermales bacterium]